MPTIKELPNNFETMTDAQKFTCLWDLGQRQFPMRGGGVSPVVKRYENKVKPPFKSQEGYESLIANDENTRATWGEDGRFWGELTEYENALDILPIPLLNFNAHLQAITQAIGEQDD